jgi:hypothetical protein
VAPPRLVRQVEALQLVDGIAQLRLRRTVRLFYRRVVRRFDRQTRLPDFDFDLLYFIEGVLRACSNERLLDAIFAGADGRWDEDDERDVTICPLPDRPPAELVAPNGWSWIARSHEAYWFGATIQDMALHQLVQLGICAIERGPTPIRFKDELPTSQRLPDAPIDMLFCAEVIFELCRLTPHIRRSPVAPPSPHG